VVHLDVPGAALAAPPTVGFVVGKAVGGSVVRNRVKRRLRHLTAARLDRLAGGSALVVRALPPAAAASYADLGADLDKCLDRVAP
jgi:ribonuclease P protein component